MKEINIGRVLIKNRHKRGITQDELATHLGVSKGAVSKWETGVTLPDISLLVPLCRVLGLTVQELLDEYDGKFGNTPGCQTTEDPAKLAFFLEQNEEQNGLFHRVVKINKVV